ncbi:MAG TPA: hypothetical protein DD827_12065 [Gammaproteobacteria bacterium]|nr:hypothetical protein [Gammaproteobacteria bacterium]
MASRNKFAFQQSKVTDMKLDKTSVGAIYMVNAKFLLTFLLGVTAWWVWPNSLKWWGLGFISITFGAAALRIFFEAIIGIKKIRTRERAVSTLNQNTIEAKSSTLVSEDDLRKAGMIE